VLGRGELPSLDKIAGQLVMVKVAEYAPDRNTKKTLKKAVKKLKKPLLVNRNSQDLRNVVGNKTTTSHI